MPLTLLSLSGFLADVECLSEPVGEGCPPIWKISRVLNTTTCLACLSGTALCGTQKAPVSLKSVFWFSWGQLCHYLRHMHKRLQHEHQNDLSCRWRDSG